MSNRACEGICTLGTAIQSITDVSARKVQADFDLLSDKLNCVPQEFQVALQQFETHVVAIEARMDASLQGLPRLCLLCRRPRKLPQDLPPL